MPARCAPVARSRCRRCARRRRSARHNSIVALMRARNATVELLRRIKTNVPSHPLLQSAKNSCAMRAIERDATHGESCCKEDGEEIRRQEKARKKGRGEKGRAQGRRQEGRAQRRGEEGRGEEG